MSPCGGRGAGYVHAGRPCSARSSHEGRLWGGAGCAPQALRYRSRTVPGSTGRAPALGNERGPCAGACKEPLTAAAARAQAGLCAGGDEGRADPGAARRGGPGLAQLRARAGLRLRAGAPVHLAPARGAAGALLPGSSTRCCAAPPERGCYITGVEKHWHGIASATESVMGWVSVAPSVLWRRSSGPATAPHSCTTPAPRTARS